MSIVVTTPTGNIGSRVLHLLLQAGERPTVLLRDPSKLGAEILSRVDVQQGDQNDADFVVRATRGATALFWLNPPSYASEDPIGEYVRKGENAAWAIRENEIGRTVFLSSVGAELRSGAGLIDGLGKTEELLEATGASVTHLRAGFFFTNFLMSLEGLRQGVLASPAPADLKMPYLDPRDIGDVAAVRLLDGSWSGRHVQVLHGPKDLTFAESAQEIAAAVGREVRYVEAPDDQFHAGLLAAGMPRGVADGYIQMYRGLRDGFVPADPRTALTSTPTTLGAWAYTNLRPALIG